MGNRESDGKESFGTRHLTNPDLMYTQNSWDNVELPQEYQQKALEIFDMQEKSKISEEQAEKHLYNASKFWDDFYAKHECKFFKDRKWLQIEFPEICVQRSKEEEFKILEIGCGVGNTSFPILSMTNSCVRLTATDFSPEAIKQVLANPNFDAARMSALTYDVSMNDKELPVPPDSQDLVICIFVLSAVNPNALSTCLANIHRMLKPGGMLLFRDYARMDLTQLRFKANRMIEKDFYIRGDGTCVHFFDKEEMHKLVEQVGFQVIQNSIDKRLLVNRATKVEMYRSWIQGKYRK